MIRGGRARHVRALGLIFAATTLVVSTGVPDALVYVDNVPQPARTDQSGTATLSLEAKGHEVRVERTQYNRPPAQRVTNLHGQVRSWPPNRSEAHIEGVLGPTRRPHQMRFGEPVGADERPDPEFLADLSDDFGRGKDN